MRRAVSKRLRELVEGLERDGYLIGATRDGARFEVKFPDHATPDFCGLMKLNAARFADPELRAALMPWLKRHRSYAHLLQQLEQR